MLGLGQEPSSSDQQAVEALAILVALRHWMGWWKERRVQLAIRTDNVAALTLVCRMQPKGTSLGIIARELALDIACSTFAPDDVAHIPGVSNIAADILSRRHAPDGSAKALPYYLKPECETHPATREITWWRSLPGSQMRS